MKIKIIVLSCLLFLTVIAGGVLSNQAFAQSGCSDNNPSTPCNVLNTECPPGSSATLCQANAAEQNKTSNSIYGKDGIITKAINLLSIVIGIAAVVVIIIGGLKYVLSAGDSNSINSAKNTILYAVVGLIISVVAQAIILFVLKRL
jgi:hypothetical protein